MIEAAKETSREVSDFLDEVTAKCAENQGPVILSMSKPGVGTVELFIGIAKFKDEDGEVLDFSSDILAEASVLAAKSAH